MERIASRSVVDDQVLLGKPRTCEPLGIDFFCRAHRLTGAETEVLRGLCQGRQPKELARQLSVAISTVRVRIGSVGSTTKSKSRGELVGWVAVLPPIARATNGQTREPGEQSR